LRPVILSLIHQRELEKISINKYNEVLTFLYNFFLCYNIIGEEKSNKLEDTIYKYSELLENNYSEDVLSDFLTSLKSKIPNLIWFTNAFKNIGWSNHWGLYKGEKNKERVKIVLETLENYLRKQNDNFTFTIEHILLDSENEVNAQIGNLIPLEEPLNARCGNKPLDQKYEIYNESNFLTARGFVKKYKDEKSFEPTKRTDFLAKMFFNDILKLN